MKARRSGEPIERRGFLLGIWGEPTYLINRPNREESGTESELVDTSSNYQSTQNAQGSARVMEIN